MQIEAHGHVGETQERTFVGASANSVAGGDGRRKLGDGAGEKTVEEVAGVVGVLGDAFAGEVFGQGQDAKAAGESDLRDFARGNGELGVAGAGCGSGGGLSLGA